MAFIDQTFGVFHQGYMGKNVYLEYVQEVYKKKAYLKPGINANGALSISVDGGALTYWTLPSNGVTTGYLGGLHTAAEGQIKGLKAKTVTIDQGEIIDCLIPAAAKLAGAAAVESIYVQNVIKAVNNINVAFVGALGTAAKDIDSTGKVSSDTGYDASKKLEFDPEKPVESITALKAAFNKYNKVSGFKPTSLFVSSEVYALLQAKNLLIFKPISLGEDQVEVYNFLGMDVTECPELEKAVVMVHRDGVFGAANLNFVIENEMDPSVPGGVSIKGEMGHAEGKVEMGEDFAGCLILAEDMKA